MNKFLLRSIVLLVLWNLLSCKSSVEYAPGVMAPEPPRQVNLVSAKRFTFKKHTITPLAEFQVKAKVLSQKCYRWGREADFSPVDLALGWGRMSDQSIVNHIKVLQMNRWFMWQTAKLPIPVEEIQRSCANMHLVPADRTIKRALTDVRKGDIVEFTGYLIRIDSRDGWHWVSSRSRSDIGLHACELVWVDTFTVVK
jgi:hypothetical protein